MHDFKLLNRNKNNRFSVLKNNSILGVASSESLQQLAEIARPLRLRKGNVLWQEGDRAEWVACVVHGCLLVQKEDDRGRVVYYHLKKTGDFLGHVAFVHSLRQPALARGSLTHWLTVTAREETVVMLIASSAFHAIMDREPRLIRQLLWDLSETTRQLMEEIFIERVHRGKYLLASKLLGLAAMEGTQEDRIDLHYSQAELARFTGVGARNIHKFLGELPAIKRISGRKGVRIDSLAALREFLRTMTDAD